MGNYTDQTTQVLQKKRDTEGICEVKDILNNVQDWLSYIDAQVGDKTMKKYIVMAIEVEKWLLSGGGRSSN